jgi:hypothetical protein
VPQGAPDSDVRPGWGYGAAESVSEKGKVYELIILNIGYDRGIITQTLFSIMVMMAVVTTLMATPIFELGYGRRGRALGTVGAVRTT